MAGRSEAHKNARDTAMRDKTDNGEKKTPSPQQCTQRTPKKVRLQLCGEGGGSESAEKQQQCEKRRVLRRERNAVMKRGCWLTIGEGEGDDVERELLDAAAILRSLHSVSKSHEDERPAMFVEEPAQDVYYYDSKDRRHSPRARRQTPPMA
jgi:hypothetical protein